MIPSFRPHIIRKVLNDEWVTLDNGDVVQGEISYGPKIRCRYEPNGKANTIQLGDGRVSVYSYSVYLDQSAPSFEFGDSVELYGLNGELIGKFMVLGFHRAQLNCKLWV